VQRLFFYRETDGIRITVRPRYLPEQSRPSQRHFVFAYFVRIENVSQETAQLVSRRWLIHDSAGRDTEVEGEGVVGEQPVLAPGRVHEYQSFCVLQSGSGHMEGSYRFVCVDGSAFEAQIPRFILDAEQAPDAAS
jgi:ApaG protein